MVDVTPPDNGRSVRENRDRYEKQKQELKEKYDKQLATLHEDYERKAHEAQQSGEAAVNHIRTQTKYRTEAAEREANEREKAVDTEVALKQDALRKRQTAEDSYLEQAKKRHSAWVQSQNENLSHEKDQISAQEKDQIDYLRATGQRKAHEAADEVNAETRHVRDAGDQKLHELKNEYTVRTAKMEEDESRKYAQSRNAHERQLENEKTAFRQVLKKENDVHARNVAELELEHSKEQDAIRTKNEADLKAERERSQRHLHETEAADRTELKQEHDRYAHSEETLREKHQEEITRLDTQQKQEMRDLKEKFKKDKNYEESEYQKQIGELKQRHEEQRHKQLQRQQTELEQLKASHEQRIQNQQVAFETRFAKNDDLAKETFANQGLILGRELINQKEKFLKAADKYANKDKDPFYQIRDNKTRFYETSGAYVLEAKVPEHEKDNVYVRVKKDKVTLSGNRSFSDEIRDGEKTVRTSNIQTFQEQYDLPKRVKESEIIKDYDNGTLRVVIPKVT